MHILGIDISKATFDTALSADNETFVAGTFDNSSQGFRALKKWLRKQGVHELHACLEATGRYGEELAYFLNEQGYTVSLVNPARIHAYAKSKLRRNKNDTLDARLIADFCYSQKPDLWQPPSPAMRELQEMTRELTALKNDRQRKRNRFQSGLTSSRTRASLKRQLRFVEQEIERLQKAIEEHIDNDPDLKEDAELLTSIPGLGPITAARFLAEVNVANFQQASQVAAYAGLVPKQETSGTSVRKRASLSKVGNRHLRNAFFMPALSAHRFNPVIDALVSRLAERGKHKMVIIGAVMRKLIHLAFGVLKTRKPFDPHHLEHAQIEG
jgi:transposase